MARPPSIVLRGLRLGVVALLAAVATVLVLRWRPSWLASPSSLVAPLALTSSTVVVRPPQSITEALDRALPGSQVVVEPGEYRERLVLKDGVRVVSRVPRAAIIRLPGAASEANTAVVAADISDAEFSGFRIIGDAATPLGTGVLVTRAHVSIVDVEISGAITAAIDLEQMEGAVSGSDIHDNPGPGLAVRSGSSPRIAHNVFVRNGLSERARASLVIDEGAEPAFVGNVFHGVSARVFLSLGDEARSGVIRDNWFPDLPTSRAAIAAPARGRQGR